MTLPLLDTTPIDRPEWLQWRREGIGGSDIAPIVGLSNWSDPADIFRSKIVEEDEEPNQAMRIGSIAETIILTEYETQFGVEVTNRQTRVVDLDHPWRRCTLDGTADGAVIEAKAVKDYAWSAIPPKYIAQVTWQMGISGLTTKPAELFVLHGLVNFERYFVEFDEAFFAVLCEKADAFWADVCAGRHPRGAVAANSDLVEAVVSLAEAKARKRDAEAAEKAAAAEVTRLLDSHDEAHVDGLTIITARPTERTTLDTEALAAAYAIDHRLTVEEVREQFATTSVTKPVLRPSAKALATLTQKAAS